MLNLGLIGCGSIAGTHVDNIVNHLKGAQVTEVFDVVREAAEALVSKYGLSAKVATSASQVIQAEDIDAVVVCSRNDTHFEPIMEAIKAHKPVFTEKPMTTSQKECQKIVDAEVQAGQRFVQVGFMRRYDPYYQQLKKTIDSGLIGAPLMGYCRHFATVPPTEYFTTENLIDDSFVHESDILHWLFNDEYKSVQVQFPRQNSTNQNEGMRDPQIVTVKMKQGAIVNVYLDMNSHYGYEIKCQVVGEKGIAQLPEINNLDLHADRKVYHEVDYDWSNRFTEAYQLELQDFIDQVAANKSPAGPTAWDGYIANVTVDRAIQSQKTEEPLTVELPQKPALYQK
ncbi:MAG TPA: Gfo/Idh/MocA family oxidoreductase [Tetragenococcus sp.]|nr:Gfo/Idh/MocA family oxidoreductase [Tetragenococcus sp.]